MVGGGGRGGYLLAQRSEAWMRLGTLYSIPQAVSEDAGSGSFGCILFFLHSEVPSLGNSFSRKLLPSERQKQCVRVWSWRLQFPSTKQRISYAITLRDDGLYVVIRYLHIAGCEGAPSPSLPTDPNSRNKLATD